MSKTSNSNIYSIFIFNQLLKYYHILTSFTIGHFFPWTFLCFIPGVHMCVCIFFFLPRNRYNSFFTPHLYPTREIHPDWSNTRTLFRSLTIVSKGFNVAHTKAHLGIVPFFHALFTTAWWVTSHNCSLRNLLSRHWDKLFVVNC